MEIEMMVYIEDMPTDAIETEMDVLERSLDEAPVGMSCGEADMLHDRLTELRAELERRSEPVSRCPACGDVIDCCQGHGDIGDPYGAETLRLHDLGVHNVCHPDGCRDAAEWQNRLSD
jgi:hypothetical protein